MSEFDLFIQKITDPQIEQIRKDKIKRYQSEISDFFKTILEYLKDYIEKKQISFRLMHNWSIEDEELGEFYVEWLKLKLGIYEINFLPRSPHIVGAFGRIDMECKNNESMFILTHKDLTDISEIPEGLIENQSNPDNVVWKYVSPDLSGKLKVLSNEVFLKAFINVVNGD